MNDEDNNEAEVQKNLENIFGYIDHIEVSNFRKYQSNGYFYCPYITIYKQPWVYVEERLKKQWKKEGF